ncbi:hypothetical protein J3459_017909 [Metarhizium acridum]|nr:hypothetical protein J3459_017909 [Metarhizium acridum]
MMHCILDKVISAPATDDDTANEQAAPSGCEEAEAACETTSAEFEAAWVKNEGGGTDDASESNGVAPENESPACKEAKVLFDKAWTANNCEAVLNAAIGASQGHSDPNDASLHTSN